ncbi:MAG: lysophospholipid acyltransferase family protein, partial [Tannerellaceae bacterium]
MKDKLISTDDLKKLHPALRGKHGDLLLKIASKVAGVDKANRVYDDSKHLVGLPFVNHLLDGLGIKRIVDNPEALQNLPEGAFITVSNHPYGHVDGITAISIMGEQRNDYKMMVNWLLSNVDCMEDYFIGVNPF